MSRFKALTAALCLLALGACSTTGGQPQTSQSVMKAAQVALTVYGDIFQSAVLLYGQLPDCPQAALCKDRDVLTKIQAADLAVTKTVTASRPVLNGSLPDGGQLGDALSAIANAERVIADSGALKLK